MPVSAVLLIDDAVVFSSLVVVHTGDWSAETDQEPEEVWSLELSEAAVMLPSNSKSCHMSTVIDAAPDVLAAPQYATRVVPLPVHVRPESGPSTTSAALATAAHNHRMMMSRFMGRLSSSWLCPW